MHLTWDRAADAAYLQLTGTALEPGRTTLDCPVPDGSPATVLADWKDGRLVGIEVLAASAVLPADLLATAEVIDGTP
jgi:uncharacterized protein YuzE